MSHVYFKRLNFIIICILVLFLLFGFVSATNDNNESGDVLTMSDVESGVDHQLITANVGNSGGNNCVLQSDGESVLSNGSSVGTYKDLNSMIKGMDIGDTLILEHDYAYNETCDSNFLFGIEISHPITIDGKGHLINGCNLAGFFTITADDVTLKNITFINGQVDSVNAPIIWNGKNGKLINANITQSRSYYTDVLASGGVYWLGADGQIIDSYFNNTSVVWSSGSASSMSGGALTVASGNLRVEHSIFGYCPGYRGVLTVSTGSSDFYIHNSYFIGSFSRDAVILFQRAGGIIDNCSFLGCYASNNVYASGQGAVVRNSYFNNMGGTRVFYSESGSHMLIDNCTVENSICSSQEVYFKSRGSIVNSNFLNTGNVVKYTVYSEGNDILIENCSFNNTKGFYFNGGNYVTINNCNITNNIVPSNHANTNFKGAVTFYGSCKHFTLSNCILENNRGRSGFGLYISSSASTVNYKNMNNTFISSTISDAGSTEFSVVKVLYVDDHTNGNGSIDNPCNLTYAISNIDNYGTIYLKKGDYTLSSRLTLYSDLIGEEGVVFYNNVVQMAIPSLTVKNIEFRNTNDVAFGYNYESKVINCLFNHTTHTTTNLINQYTNYCRDAYFINCSVIDSTFSNGRKIGKNTYNTKIFTGATGHEELHIINFTVKKCNNIYSFIDMGTPSASLYENITIEDSDIGYFMNFNSNPVIALFRDVTFENINFIRTTVKEFLFRTPQFPAVVDFNIKDVHVINCTTEATTYALFGLSYNVNVDGVEIKKLAAIRGTDGQMQSGTELFGVWENGVTLSNIEIYNVNCLSLLRSSEPKNLAINNFTAEHINVNNAFFDVQNSLYSGLCGVVSGLNFNDVNCTGYIIRMNDGFNLKDSSITNYKGNILVDGNNIKINNVIFKNGKNNNLFTNGSAVELLNGSDFFMVHCTFINNTAYNGGAVYINNETNSSYILDCVFHDNTASNLGGAVFVESGIYYFISSSTRDTFNTTFRYNDLYDDNTYVFMEDVWVVSNVVTGNGTYDDPTGFNDAFNRVSPFGTIHFRISGDVFDYTALPYLDKTCVKINLTFMGNNTTIKGLTFICGEYATGVSIYNFIFSDYSKNSVIFWQGDNGKIVNCSFINNGGFDVGDGAAVNVDANNLNIINCSFINNTAGLDESLGGAIYCNGENLIIKDSVFENNHVRDAGGHIYLSEDSYGLRIINSSFKDGDSINVGHKGSGLYLLSSNYIISNSNFTKNHGSNGGALYLGGSGRIVDSLFFDNSATNGSSIYIKKNGVSISNSCFASPKFDENNNIIEGYVYSSYDVALRNNTLSFTDLNKVVSDANNNLDLEYNYKYFKDYDAPFKSGVTIDKTLRINGHSYRLDGSNLARVFKVSGNNVKLSNMTFVNGYATSAFASGYNNGGAISASGSNLNISYCNFDSCTANHASAVEICGSGCSVHYCNFTNNYANRWDGALCFFSTVATGGIVESCNFINNSAERWAAGIRADATIRIDDCTFVNNSGKTNGGALYLTDCTSNSVISNSVFTANSANYGGAVFNAGASNINFDKCIFKDNYARVNGGAVYMPQTSSFNNSYFTNNSALTGSAIYAVGDLSVGNSVFGNPKYNETNNYLEGYIHCLSTVEYNNITLSFTDLNRTVAFAGDNLDLIFNYMFFNDYDGAFVSGVPISKDFTINGNSFILDGNHSARIFNVTGDNTVFSNLTFRNGNATLGGAIYVIGNITVLNSNFTNNSAVLGGAIFIESGHSNFTNCIFDANNATNGSAIYIITSVNHWDNLDFINNIASTNATIYFREDSTVYSDNLTFTDNIIPNGLHIVGENHIYSPVIYVNSTKQGFGIIMSEPTSLTRAVDNILDNGIIIICSDYILETIIKLNNLTNVTVTGNHTLRRDKHLFILPNTIQYNTVIQ